MRTFPLVCLHPVALLGRQAAAGSPAAGSPAAGRSQTRRGWGEPAAHRTSAPGRVSRRSHNPDLRFPVRPQGRCASQQVLAPCGRETCAHGEIASPDVRLEIFSEFLKLNGLSSKFPVQTKSSHFQGESLEFDRLLETF